MKFTPIVKSSTDIPEDLLNAANSRGISADRVDFDLLSYETYFKGTVDEEWQLLEGNDLLTQTTEIEIRSEHFQLRQEYQIRIRSPKPHPYLDLRFSIATDKTKSKAVAILDPSSTIPLKKGVQEWIKEAITRKKLLHKLFIGIGEDNLDQEINRLLLKIQKEGPLTAPYRLPIAECFPSVAPLNDAVLLHYKQLKKEKNLIEGVHPGDLLLEYVFPKHGRDGRSCNGQHIAVPEPIVKYSGFIVIDDATIRSEQNEESIRFYASVSGFIQRQKEIFSIAQELKIESASFKKTGSIEAGMDKDIALTIKQNISSQDAVGMGVNIDVQKLDISGTVGDNAKIQACELTIGSQTHKKSQINVTEIANIHLHRGNLKAKEANINILEAGKIEADIVRIKEMAGGEIIARIVHIETLYSNARITALESITIDNIKGEGNNLIINPHSINAYHEQIAALETDIRTKNSHLQEESKEFIARQISFKEKSSRIKQFQQRIIDAQKNGTTPMKADVARIQQYRAEAETLKQTAEELREKEAHIDTLRTELEKFYDADLHAVVTHHGNYSGHDRIVFIDPKTHQEYAISPKGKATHVRLRREGDEKRLIVES
ncbi:hypothetical protein [Sulfuricurvum sp.]|uniref:hypothetical protein n=1 Tax=Sulfuricurvum sp. TaxID=2025608 RepID=UPI0035684744